MQEQHENPALDRAARGEDATPRSLSVVVPVQDEEENVLPLLERTLRALRPLGVPFEVIFVDDGSRDQTAPRLRERVGTTPELVLLELAGNRGQSVALQAGFDRARGDVIVTLDGDLQNDPADIPRLLEEIAEGADVVSGWRQQRRDKLLLRKAPSWAANRLIRALTRTPIHDQGCALKAYRREVLERLRLYSDMHRFIVVLTMAVGASIVEVPVRHHARLAGRSKYGLSRVFKVLTDLLIIQMLTRFQESPTRWFSLLGLPFLAAAVASGLATLGAGSATVVPTTLTLVFGLAFLWCVLAGLLGEIVIATSRGRSRRRVVFRELRAAR